MVASPVTVVPIYLDCTERFAVAGGVSSLEDDTSVIEADSRLTYTNERSERALQTWQLTWNDARVESADAKFLWELFRVCRNSKAFLFISPKDEEREAFNQPLRNTATQTNLGDGATTTFQLQFVFSLEYSIGVGEASVETFDVNYPLAESVVVYADGVEVAVAGFSLVTGIVTLADAPSVGAVMTADYERAIAVMFTSSTLGRTLQEANHSEARSVQFKEIL